MALDLNLPGFGDLFERRPDLARNPANLARIVSHNRAQLAERVNRATFQNRDIGELLGDLLTLVAWCAGASAENQTAHHLSQMGER